MKINVFTGPVLDSNDPLFVTKVKNKMVPLPVVFWKVAIFSTGPNQLAKVGFLMSQRSLLLENEIVAPSPEATRDLFMEFEMADTYQVNMSVIEGLTGIKFPAAHEPYSDDRPLKLILEEIDVNERGALLVGEENDLGIRIPNLVI
jgi:endonuclease G